ncbi:hypothetical protein JTB14_002454 [Gonioctena quinquepunctata]|nr:hypothetical protein JTB14_002454 [Gonioctena quinquepunctata]
MRGSTAGLPDNLQGYSAKYYTLLTVLDSLFASLIVCPCVVGYWRAVWGLMDIYLSPFGTLNSGLISIAVGISGHMFFALFQKVFEKNFHPDRNQIIFYLVSRLYTVCFAFICVNGWRGPWECLNFHSKTEMFPLFATTMVGVVALISIRGLRNVTASPFVIVNDDVKGYFEVMTMFRIQIGDRTTLYVLDCLFSVLIVGSLVVFVWRGVWMVLDLFLFPEDETVSSWGSLILGYICVIFAFILQPAMRYICERLSGFPRLLVADLFILFALFGTVNVWRGIWNLLNIYFLPDDMELSCWITHWVCLIVLILCRCSNSLLVRGVYIDAEEPAGKCVVFPCYYLRVIFRKRKLKKLNLTSVSLDSIVEVKVNHKEDKGIDNHVHISTITTTIEENNIAGHS